MPKKYHVRLEPTERQQLEDILSKGKAAAQTQRRARILLKADENRTGGALSDLDIAQALEIGLATVERTRKALVEEGFETALRRKPTRRVYEKKIDGHAEARLIALACGKPPEGQARWTIKLLADQLVELEILDSVGEETVRSALKKTSLNLGKKSSGA